MRRSNSESELSQRDMSKSMRTFLSKTRTPGYSDRKTAEILADNEIENLMEEIEETTPRKIVNEENKFIKKVYKTKASDNDSDFEKLAEKPRGGKKTRKQRRVTRRRNSKKNKSRRNKSRRNKSRRKK